MKKKIIKHGIILLVLVILIAPLLYYNFKNNETFFKVPFTSIVSALAVVYVSFYLTQWRNDTREKIKHIGAIIDEIKFIINSDDLYLINSEMQKQRSLILQRKVANKITILKHYDLNNKIKCEIKALDDNYKELREFLGNHINDSEYIQKSKNEIARMASKIENNCDEICVYLHE